MSPHNIEDVIKDVEEVKNDLQVHLHEKLRDEMRRMLQTAITHVEKDADWKGNLTRSLRSHGVDSEWRSRAEWQYSIGTDEKIAPYGPFVEFGTGSKSDNPASGSYQSIRPPHDYPAGYPYEAPAMSPALVANIIEWVKTKPITPKQGDPSDEELGARIAAEIVEKGTHAHPFLRPAWYKHRLQIRQQARSAVKKAFR